MGLFASSNNYVWQNHFGSNFFDSCSQTPKLITSNPSSDNLNFEDWFKAFPETIHNLFISFSYEEIWEKFQILVNVIFRHFYIFSIFYHLDFSAFFTIQNATEIYLQIVNIISISLD